MKLVFATHNQHKFKEVQQLMPKYIKLLNLNDIGCTEDIAETATTIEGNAMLKANYVFKRYGYACFADDTGLEVDALNGAPGVYSARYAGAKKNAVDNMQKLLTELESHTNRNAQFKTIIALHTETEQLLFEGIVTGKITREITGKDGFGYDPIFQPKGYEQTFAELAPQEKNSISHRGIAIQKLLHYLKK
jgi:XTP/dITP diphosphohydrolase